MKSETKHLQNSIKLNTESIDLKFRSLEEQTRNRSKISGLKRRREPAKMDQKISKMIQTVSEKTRHHVDIVQDDDYEFLQWLSKDSQKIERQAEEIRDREANIEYEYFLKKKDAFRFKVFFY